MESKQDNDTDKLLIIDVFIDKDNLHNKDYFLSEQKASEPVSIADIYFNDEFLNETLAEKPNSRALDEKLFHPPESKAPFIRQPDFIIIENANLNSRIIIDCKSCDNSLSADEPMINLNRLSGNNRSILRKILPKTNTVNENAGITNNEIISAIITYKCILCSLLFANFKDYQAHLKDHYFSCEECPEIFSNQLDLLNHLRFTHSYSIIKRPEGMDVQKVEVLKVFPSPMIENIELGNGYEDLENFYVVEDELEENESGCDDGYITLEEAKELQMKMEEEALGKKNVKRFRNV